MKCRVWLYWIKRGAPSAPPRPAHPGHAALRAGPGRTVPVGRHAAKSFAGLDLWTWLRCVPGGFPAAA